MDSTPNIAKIGALLGDNARARMLSALMHGKALTASELATEAGITAQTATTHLSKLEAGGLLLMRGPRDERMRVARVCYNHLAGYKGIQLYDYLISSSCILDKKGSLIVTAKGERFVGDLGIDLNALRASRSPLCRTCLDWSERRTHLAGSLGRALFERFEQLRWLKRVPGSRAIKFSVKGDREFNRVFKVN